MEKRQLKPVHTQKRNVVSRVVQANLLILRVNA